MTTVDAAIIAANLRVAVSGAMSLMARGRFAEASFPAASFSIPSQAPEPSPRRPEI